MNQNDVTQKPKPPRWRKILGGVLLGLAVLAVAAALAVFFWARSLEKKMQFEPGEAEEIERELKEPERGEAWHILLVGADRRPGETGGRADTIMILRVDLEEEQLHLLSIPRDSRVNIPGSGLDKINHSFAYGGAPLLIRTIEDFTGLDINYYFQVDFEGLKAMVDEVGGIEYEIDRGWTSGGVTVRSGRHVRGGREALAILRCRDYPDGDFTRIENQQRFVAEAMKQCLTSYTRVPRLANITATYTKTNMDLYKMISMGQSFVGAESMEKATVPGSTGMRGGVSYVFPDEEAKSRLIEAMKEGEPFPKN